MKKAIIYHYSFSSYNISIQVGRKSFPIPDKGIKDKVRDYINQRIKELEEEFKAL